MAQRRDILTVWLIACFMASFFSVGFGEAERAQSTAEDVQESILSSWAHVSEVASNAFGTMSELMESQGLSMDMVGVGAAGAAALAFTLFIGSRYLDKEPYLFNKGKLGKLEANSIYNSKKCC